MTEAHPIPEPRYRWIADDLHRQIKCGEFRPGDQLPSELELRERYNASRNGIRDAIKLLIVIGVVETRPGQGSFVVAKMDPIRIRLATSPLFGYDETVYLSEMEMQSRIPSSSVPLVEISEAYGVVASELQLGSKDNIVSRHQQRYVDDIPWSLQTTFYPMKLVEQGAAELLRATDIQNGAVRYIEERLHKKQLGWRDKIIARSPNSTEADFFCFPQDGDVVVFEVFRTGFDEAGEPFRLTVTVYPADRNKFELSVGHVPDAADRLNASTSELQATHDNTLE